MALATTKNANSALTLGFLTVLDYEQEGLFGGYLALNVNGRPLEFHCTAPIKPNRAQEILYGPTLQPYLYGEQIGQTLLAKSASNPVLVCTDREAALSVRDFVDVPVALVYTEDDESGEDKNNPSSFDVPDRGRAQVWRIDSAHLPGTGLMDFHLGCNHLAVHARASEDRQTITQRLDGMAESFDLSEPFTRIREAIEEARRGGG